MSKAWDTFVSSPFQVLDFCSPLALLPFQQRIGLRGRIATFESQFGDSPAEAGLIADVEFLSGLEPGIVNSGACDFPLQPFLCDLPVEADFPTGQDVLDALHPRHFRSEHIESLDSSSIAYPGYHPMTDNDEIHTDAQQQYLLPPPSDEAEFARIHQPLKDFVKGGRLWYVLLHFTPTEHTTVKGPTYSYSDYVSLVAVGVSRNGPRLLGVLAQQMCHNLCD